MFKVRNALDSVNQILYEDTEMKHFYAASFSIFGLLSASWQGLSMT